MLSLFLFTVEPSESVYAAPAGDLAVLLRDPGCATTLVVTIRNVANKKVFLIFLGIDNSMQNYSTYLISEKRFNERHYSFSEFSSFINRSH